MRNLTRRLEALEQQHVTADPLRITRIIIAPGGEQMPVLGWKSGDIETRRRAGETEAACWDRHAAALDDAHGRHAVTQSVQLTEGEA